MSTQFEAAKKYAEAAYELKLADKVFSEARDRHDRIVSCMTACEKTLHDCVGTMVPMKVFKVSANDCVVVLLRDNKSVVVSLRGFEEE